MKVLYISVYRDGTGWAQHAINNILALDSVGVDVVPRAVRLNDAKVEIPERILELEQNNTNGCTHVVQQVLPNMMEYHADLKNIAYISLETSSCKRSGWPTYLNMMDELWVPCWHNLGVAKNSGVKIPIEIVPMPLDIEKYYNKYDLMPELSDLVNKFVFYYVGEVTARKDLTTILRAFHSEFEPHEPVELLLKVNCNNNHIDSIIKSVKHNLKIRPENQYKNEIVINGRLDEKSLNGLHANLDCFVFASRGEAVGIPMLDALGFGAAVVAPRHSGIEFYLSDDVGYGVDYIEAPCFGGTDTIPDLYSAEENWYPCSVLSMMKQMRAAYQASAEEKMKRKSGATEDIKQLSFTLVGARMKELLNA